MRNIQTKTVRPNKPLYDVIVEKGATSFGAYVPDLPGCVAVAKTEKEVEMLIEKAIDFNLEGHSVSGKEFSF